MNKAQDTNKVVLVVTGGREYTEESVITMALKTVGRELGATRENAVVVHGNARGADRLAGAWAESVGVRTVAVPAQWKAEGSRAGFKRNVRIVKRALANVERGDTVVVVAFPGGTGTDHMVRTCREAGLRVFNGLKLAHQPECEPHEGADA